MCFFVGIIGHVWMIYAYVRYVLFFFGESLYMYGYCNRIAMYFFSDYMYLFVICIFTYTTNVKCMYNIFIYINMKMIKSIYVSIFNIIQNQSQCTYTIIYKRIYKYVYIYMNIFWKYIYHVCIYSRYIYIYCIHRYIDRLIEL